MRDLHVADFARAPPPVVYSYINDSARLSWDLTLLLRLSAASFRVHVTTPITGRMPFHFYADRWLPLNARPSYAGTRATDPLQPTIQVDLLFREFCTRCRF